MKISNSGLELIKEFEGLRLKAYKCPAAVWTIGYGHTSAAGEPNVLTGMIISKDEAEAILRRDVVQYENGVRSRVTVPIAQGQFDALVSFAYNAGVGALQKSTLLKKVNAGKFDEVPAEFMKWTRGGGKELPGLVRRRRAEVKLWRGMGANTPIHIDEARSAPDVPKPKRSIVQSKEANGAVVAGGASAIAIVQEVMPIIQDGGSLISSIGNPTVAICLIVVAAAAAIWYFRKQRLDEDGA
jgi:GH24 family phage-related lysozyme (muramidase)